MSCFLIDGACNFRSQVHPLWGNGNKRVYSQHITALVVHLLHLLKGLVIAAGHAASTILLCLVHDEGLEPCRLTQDRHCVCLYLSFVLNTFLYHECIILLLRLHYHKIWNWLA